MKYMTKMKRGRGGIHRVLEHTYPELSVARVTTVFFYKKLFYKKASHGIGKNLRK